MKSRLAWKLVALFALGVLFFIPQIIITLIGNERRRYRDEALADIAQSNAGGQCVTGPLLVLPYRVRHVTRENDTNGRTLERESFSDEELVVLPESLDVRGALELETRYRGIYSARLYRTRVALKGTIEIPAIPRPIDGVIASWGTPRLLVGVSDPRGMREPPVFTWQGQPLSCEPGTTRGWLGAGLHADAGDAVPAAAARRMEFGIDLPLVGTQTFRLVPVGRRTDVRLESRWPHPSFAGRFLPDERQVGASGFTATWRLSRFATSVEDLVASASRGGTGESPSAGGVPSGPGLLERSAFGVEFLEPVDTYRLTERALKYGMLFVLLTFLAFFMMEVLGGLNVHPVQYALIAGALTIFFLLLLSLSEHMPYPVAYLLASAACVLLISVYVRHVLGGAARAAGFGAGLAVLYALLYVVMRSQDYALLLGSALLFAALAFVMLATRRVDWSRIGEAR